MDEFLRQAFFIEDALDHGPVAAGALQPANQCPVAASGEVVYVSQDGVVHGEGQLRNRGRHLLPHLILQLGVHGKGHLQDVFQWGLFELAFFDAGRGAQACQIHAVDGVHHFIQLVLVFLAVGGILVRGVQHRVDGGVEFPAGVPGIVALVIPLTGFKLPIGAPDERIRASPALGELRIGQQEGGNILQVQIGLDDGRFGQLHYRTARGSRRQEGHAEPGRLIQAASSGYKGYGGQEKGEERLLPNFHYCLEIQKISYFREPVPGYDPKRLQRFTYVMQAGSLRLSGTLPAPGIGSRLNPHPRSLLRPAQ